jgi:uncharacterized protein
MARVAAIHKADLRGVKKFQEVTGDRFVFGVVLYDGETTLGFGEKLFAVPIRALWTHGSHQQFGWPR